MFVMHFSSLVQVSSILLAFAARVRGQGATSCSGSQMDWYTSVVGETPCRTYERLRQACNAEYQVPALSKSLPPDFCTDQISDCCCNSIAFSLSMLCLNCQQPIGTGTGIDAAAQTMQNYLNASTDGTRSRQSHCYEPVMNGLQQEVQSAVCNQRIKIFDQLYPIVHSDGSWFYVNTRDTVHFSNNALANNSFTKCGDTFLANNTSPTSNSSSASSPGAPTTTVFIHTSTPAISAGAVAGIAVGATLLVVGLVATALFLFLRRRRGRRASAAASGTSPAPSQGAVYFPVVGGRQIPAQKTLRAGDGVSVSSSGSSTGPPPPTYEERLSV